MTRLLTFHPDEESTLDDYFDKNLALAEHEDLDKRVEYSLRYPVTYHTDAICCLTVLNRCIGFTHKEFDNKAKIYEICNKYANEWFPPDTITPALEHKKPLYKVYTEWEKRENFSDKDIEDLRVKRKSYTIYRELPSAKYYHYGKPVNLEGRLREFLLEMLRHMHDDSILLNDWHKVLNRDDKSYDKKTHEEIRKDKNDFQDDLSKPLHLCSKEFGNPFTGRSTPSRWAFDSPAPRYTFDYLKDDKSFSYCLIEPMSK